MEATARIVIPEGSARGVTDLDILRKIEEAGVKEGLDKIAVTGLIAQSRKAGFAEGVIAKGKPAEHGVDGRIAWKSGDPTTGVPIIVKAGTVIAQVIPPTLGAMGVNVKGEKIRGANGAEVRVTAGRGVKMDQKSRSWSALVEGRVLFSDGRLSVEPHTDAGFSLTVAPDGTAAFLTITPRKGTGADVSIQRIMAEADRLALGCVDDAEVKAALERAAEGKPVQNHVIARSAPPRFELNISADWREAVLQMTVPMESVKERPLESLARMAEEALADMNITTGVDKPALETLIATARSEGGARGVVARGFPPQDGKDGRFEWLIGDPSAAGGQAVPPGPRMAPASEGGGGPAFGGDILAVEAGQVVARYEKPSAGVPGSTVTGIALPAKAGAESPMVPGRGLKFDRQAGLLFSDAAGRLVLRENVFSVEPHDNASFTVVVDPNGARVRISLTPARGTGAAVKLEDILADLEKRRISGVSRPLLESLVAKAAAGVASHGIVIAESEPPKAEIQVLEDGMKASLAIRLPRSPVAPVSSTVLEKIVKDALDERLLKGVDHAAVRNVIERAADGESSEEIIARGRPPQKGREGEIRWQVPHAFGSPDAEPVIVPSGKILAVLAPATKGIAGESVTGEPIPPEEGKNPSLKLGIGIRFDERRLLWHAVNPGRLDAVDGVLSIKPHLDASFSLEITPDGLQAFLTMIPRAGEGKEISLEEVIQEVNRLGLRNPDLAAIENAVIRASNGQETDTLLLARGVPPVPGKDGRVEILIESAAQSVALARRGVPALTSVKAGDRIARIHPAEPGSPGEDVRGNLIEPPAVKAPDVAAGIGTVLENAVIRAERNGNVIIRPALIEVREILEFPGDLTTAMGEVEFAGDIVVGGDVGDNVSVRAGGDVFVKGGVSSARIISGGDIEIGTGFAGRDKGLLKAGGTIRVQFVERGAVEAGRDIHIMRTSLHGRLLAGGSIEITEERGAFVGGAAAALLSFRAKILGAESGAESSVTVGAEPYVERDVRELDARLVEMRTALAAIVEALKEASALLLREKSPITEMSFRELTRKKVILTHELKQSLRRRSELAARQYPDVRGIVEILDTVRPGVKIRIRETSTVISNAVERARFELTAEGLVVSSIR